jgi:uracil-DNA glycosylase
VVLTLGKIAFDSYKYLLKGQGSTVEGLEFCHGALYSRDEGQLHLAVSYHPSRQNTQIRKLKREA